MIQLGGKKSARLSLQYRSVVRWCHLRPIYTWVRFRIRLAHFPKYKNNYILKNGLAYCEIALRNRTCKQAFSHVRKMTTMSAGENQSTVYYYINVYGASKRYQMTPDFDYIKQLLCNCDVDVIEWEGRRQGVSAPLRRPLLQYQKEHVTLFLFFKA